MNKVLITAIVSLSVNLLPLGSRAAEPLPYILDMVHHNPGMPLYESSYNDPEVLSEMGFNGKVYYLFDSPILAVDWDEVDPNILPEGSPEEAWVAKKSERLHREFGRCKKAGVDVYAMCDLILFPKNLVNINGMQETFGDPRDPKTREFLVKALDLMFKQFPEMDGLVVRIGETYLHDAPHHAGHINDKGNPEKTIIPLMQLLREEVVVKRGKPLIFRSWISFDTEVNTYMKVSNAVEPHDKLIFSIKHCEGDFFRGQPFSKVLGIGRHKQLIEVQCAREYEGKGAYPNYIAHGVIEGFEEDTLRLKREKPLGIREIYEDSGLVCGVWTWTRGGGWEGPFIKNELWCDVNAWVMAQWAKDPAQSEESILARYASERLGLKGEDIQRFRKLCLLSADAVIRGRRSIYYEDLPREWTRDEYIGWPNIAATPEQRKRVLEQKDESVKMWKEMLSLAEKIQWQDDETRAFAITSTEYGLQFYSVAQALFHLRQLEFDENLDAMPQWIAAYDAAWKAFEALGSRSECSTLYQKRVTKRMGEKTADIIVDKYRKALK